MKYLFEALIRQRIWWFFFLAIFVVTIFGYPYISLPRVIDLSEVTYMIGENVGDEWSDACISSESRLPNVGVLENKRVECTYFRMVPENDVVLTYFDGGGGCEMMRFHGSFRFLQNSEVACFPREQIEGLTLVETFGIINFGEKND
jgi:hypothetical protein